jgi:hypothetical protein
MNNLNSLVSLNYSLSSTGVKMLMFDGEFKEIGFSFAAGF